MLRIRGVRADRVIIATIVTHRIVLTVIRFTPTYSVVPLEKTMDVLNLCPNQNTTLTDKDDVSDVGNLLINYPKETQMDLDRR